MIPVHDHMRLTIGIIALGAAVALGAYANLRPLNIINPHREILKVFRTIEASEDLIASLEPRLEALGKSVMNLELPDHQSLTFFENPLTFTDLGNDASPLSSEELFPSASVKIREWQITGKVHGWLRIRNRTRQHEYREN